MRKKQEDPQQRPLPFQEKPIVPTYDVRNCIVCGTPMESRHCKYRCTSCGTIMDCSDPF